MRIRTKRSTRAIRTRELTSNITGATRTRGRGTAATGRRGGRGGRGGRRRRRRTIIARRTRGRGRTAGRRRTRTRVSFTINTSSRFTTGGSFTIHNSMTREVKTIRIAGRTRECTHVVTSTRRAKRINFSNRRSS